MLATPLEYPLGSSVEYSDLGFRILGKLLETVAGMRRSTRSPSARSGARSA